MSAVDTLLDTVTTEWRDGTVTDGEAAIAYQTLARIGQIEAGETTWEGN